MLAGLLNGALAGLGETIHEGEEGPMLVWRVQNAQGKGPYRKGPAAGRGDLDPNLPSKERALYRFVMSGDRYGKHPEITSGDARLLVGSMLQPVPPEDFERHEWHAMPEATLKQYKFGFPTKRAAADWLGTKALARLEQEGFKLVQVPARRVVLSKSGRQLLFVPWSTKYRAPPKDYYAKYLKRIGARVNRGTIVRKQRKSSR